MEYIKKLKLFTWTDLFYKPLGIAIVIAATILISALICYGGALSGLAIIALLVGFPVVVAIIAYPQFGIMALLVAAYFIMWINRMVLSYPMGVVMDIMQALLAFGFIIKHKFDRDWSFAKSTVSALILVWIGYNIMEVANPVALSKLAWVYTIRSVAFVTLTYFIFVYHIKSVKFIRLIIITWLVVSAIAALYAIFQEFHGFLPFEERWMASEPTTLQLYFIAGRWRRFGIFADPVHAAYNMVISSLLSVVMMYYTRSLIKKLGLLALTILFTAAMLYAGIRGAFILLPAGLALLFLLKLTKKTFIIGIIGALVFVFLVKVPTSNVLLYRFQTAFRPQYDPSFNVRKTNLKRIQPYIQSHPIGGGLGATGTWGRRFSPNSFLASFPPDSGFVRVAVETGWVGLLLLCALLFVVLKTGITNFFLIQNRELKHYCLAMVLVIFVLTIGNYPQEALVQFPTNVYFYLAIALIQVTLRLDQNLQQAQTSPMNIH